MPLGERGGVRDVVAHELAPLERSSAPPPRLSRRVGAALRSGMLPVLGECAGAVAPAAGAAGRRAAGDGRASGGARAGVLG